MGGSPDGAFIVVADTSVLINFLRIDRMDLIGAHPASFIATDHVSAEITGTYPDQQAQFAAALDEGQLTEERVDDSVELEMFLRLAAKGRLGAGERAAIAVALNRGCALAIDNSRAIHRALQEAALGQNALTILRTQDVMIELIRRRIITVEAAGAILLDWAANHRFRLKIACFQELFDSI